MKLLAALCGLTVCALGTGAIVAALWHLDASIAAKILTATFALLLTAILAKLSAVASTLDQIRYAARLSYVAIETQRLHPDDIRPARDILNDDLAEEAEATQAADALTGGSASMAWAWALYGGGAIAAAVGLILYWP